MPPQPVDEEKGEAGIVAAENDPAVTQDATKEEPFGKSDDRARSVQPGSPTSTANSRSSSTTLFENPGEDFKRFVTTLRRILCPWKRQEGLSTNDYKPKYIVRELHETPNGYPRLAAFLDSDDNFMLYRRFGYLVSRLLLDKQDDLRLLENELDQIDAVDNEVEPGDVNLLRTREYHGEDYLEPRVNLMQKIEKKFLEYSKLLSTAKEMAELNKPTTSEFFSVHYWMKREDPLSAQDAQFIRHREDLITLRPGREHAWLDAAVEKMLRALHLPWVGNLFRSEETRQKMAGSKGITYYSRERISFLVNTIMILMILVLLIIPVYILFHVTDSRNDTPGTEGVCVGVLLLSTLAFSAGVSLFSRAKRHEVLASSAAYCAVLVVFIGNIGGRGLGSAFKAPK